MSTTSGIILPSSSARPCAATIVTKTFPPADPVPIRDCTILSGHPTLPPGPLQENPWHNNDAFVGADDGTPVVGGSEEYSVGDTVCTGTFVGKNVNVGTEEGTDVGTKEGSLLSVGLRVGSTESDGSCVGIGDGMDVGAADGVSVGNIVMFGLYTVGFRDGIAVGTEVGIPVGTADGRAMNVGCAVCGYVGTCPTSVGTGTATVVGIGEGPAVGTSVGRREVDVGQAYGARVGSGVCASERGVETASTIRSCLRGIILKHD